MTSKTTLWRWLDTNERPQGKLETNGKMEKIGKVKNSYIKTDIFI